MGSALGSELGSALAFTEGPELGACEISMGSELGSELGSALAFTEGPELGACEISVGSALGSELGSDVIVSGVSVMSGSPVQLGPSRYTTQSLQLPALKTTAILPPVGSVTPEKVISYDRCSLPENPLLSLTPVTQVGRSHSTFVSAASVPSDLKLSRQHTPSNATVTEFRAEEREILELDLRYNISRKIMAGSRQKGRRTIDEQAVVKSLTVGDCLLLSACDGERVCVVSTTILVTGNCRGGI